MNKRIPFYAQILFCMALGVGIGTLLGSRAAPLGELGKLLIQAIKTLAVPFLFFAVLDAFLKAEIRLKSAFLMLGISAANALLALSIGLGLANWLEPGKHLSVAIPPMTQMISSSGSTQSLSPTSPLQPFLDNAILITVLLAMLGGLALRRTKPAQLARASAAIEKAFAVLQLVLGWVVRIVPLAVLGIVAKTVGQYGLAPLWGLGAYLGAILLGLGAQVFFVYQAWILLFSRRSLREFWGGAKEAIIYALGASSSMATLPVTLRCLDQMKVSPEASRLGACVGTNFNNDGILLYEAMAAIFIAQAYGVPLDLGQQALIALSCMLATLGIAGVPDAGLISLSLVLNAAQLPTEILPLLLTVDWILSRARAITNVIADIVVSVLIDRQALANKAA